MLAIEAQNLGKCYRKRGIGAPTLHGRVGEWLSKTRPEPFWAIRNLNFKITKGQTVGIIGPNGSGKSSTLGLTAGTIAASEGWVRAEGRISSLLELGAGFHPDLSGRENIFLNAALLGIPREDIRKRIDHIIDFSELEGFIDEPVKTYSSGMYVRLGFAVALQVKPEIMLVDEVLAVGDMRFQQKCLEALNDFKKAGHTALFVSHDLGMVHRFCDDVMLVNQGELIDRGESDYMIGTYQKMVMGDQYEEEEKEEKEEQEGRVMHKHEHGSRDVEITTTGLFNLKGEETTVFQPEEPIVIELNYEVHRSVPDVVFGFSIKSIHGALAFGTNSMMENVTTPILDKKGRVTITLQTLNLSCGVYHMSFGAHSRNHLSQYHRKEDWINFEIKGEILSEGPLRLSSEWRVE